jgi:hypothetical protein
MISPVQQSGTTPWARNQPYMAGPVSDIQQDATDIGEVSRRGCFIHTVISVTGPATVTFSYVGARLPFTLVVTVTEGGSDVVTEYDMGVSNETQEVILTSLQAITDVSVKRRF